MEIAPSLIEVAKIILEDYVSLETLIKSIRNPLIPSVDVLILEDDESYEEIKIIVTDDEPEDLTLRFWDMREILFELGPDEASTYKMYYQKIENNGVLLKIIDEVNDSLTWECCSLMETIFKESYPFDMNTPGQVLASRNPQLPHASDGVGKRVSFKKGHHLVTNRALMPFEVVARERPIILQVVPNCKCETETASPLLRCHHCSAVFTKQFSCDYCNIVVYCSQTCLITANNSYHKYECYGFQRHFWSMDLHDHSYIAMRMMIMGMGFLNDDTTILYAHSYPAIYNLKSNFRFFHIADINEILYKITKSLVYLIEKTRFFQRWPENLHEMYIYAGGLMLRHYCQAQINCIYLDYPNPLSDLGFNVSSGKGKAICPTIALLNHSCIPNCTMVVHSDSLVIKALGAIQENEELTICYHEVGPFLSKKNRSDILKMFHFTTCECYRCSLENKPNAIYRCYICFSPCEMIWARNAWWGKCTKCLTTIDYTWIVILKNQMEDRISKFEETRDVELLEKISEAAEKIYHSRSPKLLETYKYICDTADKVPFCPIHIKYGLFYYSILDYIYPITYHQYLEDKYKIFEIMNERYKKVMFEISDENCQFFTEWFLTVINMDNILRHLLPPWNRLFEKVKNDALLYTSRIAERMKENVTKSNKHK